MVTVRETIRKLSASHLENGFMIAGQCLRAVGNVGGTLPEDERLTELSMCDVAGGGFVTGMALAAKRPIYVIRYQGFSWLNLPFIVSYAAKCKSWGLQAPVFVRAIAMEGGIGPVAGSSHHTLVYRMPGIKLVSPMTPKEYEACYADFMVGNDPVFVSEHRGSYDNSDELPNRIDPEAKITLFPISITRFACVEAAKILENDGIKVDIVHQVRIGEDHMTPQALTSLSNTKRGLVLDDDYVDGLAGNIAGDLMRETGCKVDHCGLPKRVAGFSKDTDVLPPSVDAIVTHIKDELFATRAIPVPWV